MGSQWSPAEGRGQAWRDLAGWLFGLCARPACLVSRTRATTPLTGFAPPSLASLAPTILSWQRHRTVASRAMVSCLAVTTPTPPRSANSTASACRTRSARTPSTRSTSSAPTAPSSTSSSSTATGGSTWTARHLRASMVELREHLELQEAQEEERTQVLVQQFLLDLLMSALEQSPPAGVLDRGTLTALGTGSAVLMVVLTPAMVSLQFNLRPKQTQSKK